MKDLGISIKEVAVIYAFLPFTSFVGPPIMGKDLIMIIR
jgi:hypothetical protein